MSVIEGCLSDRGIKKPMNQDRIISRILFQDDHYLLLAGIFDGISSLADSERVAELLKTSFEQWFDDVEVWVSLCDVDAEILCCHLLDVLDHVSSIIYEARIKGEYNGGSTASVILVLDEHYYIYHIGDSKVYLLRNGSVIQLTEDQVKIGQVQGVTRSFLANYVGRATDVEAAYYSGTISAGDTIIYGSDGFFQKLNLQELLLLDAQVEDKESLETVISTYVEDVKSRGETDNISVGVIKTLK